MAYSLSELGDCSAVDFLDFPVFPDDHGCAGIDRTLDDLLGGLSKSGLHQLGEWIIPPPSCLRVF
jgi:hypothetical protein